MSQNKIMTRNADILQEQNRALHDFILYNMRKDEKAKHEQRNINPQQISNLLEPLYKNLSDLQNEVKSITSQKKLERIPYCNVVSKIPSEVRIYYRITVGS